MPSVGNASGIDYDFLVIWVKTTNYCHEGRGHITFTDHEARYCSQYFPEYWCVLLFNRVIPISYKKLTALYSSIRQLRPEIIVKEGVFSNDIDNYSIKVGKNLQWKYAL